MFNIVIQEKVMVISDLHIPFIDFKAFDVMMSYAEDYEPNTLVIAGDLVDFYRLSKFDKDPTRKDSTQDEIDLAKEYLYEIRNRLPTTHIVLQKGNHESRIQTSLWQNPEFHSLRAINLKKLLDLDNLNIEYMDGTYDYWKESNCHLKIGDMLVMHGDNRLNGAKLSCNTGYSAWNTMKTMMSSVSMGHNHRLALINMRTVSAELVGIETGCLCQVTGTQNWQQGFATFEVIKGKTVNPRIYKINNGTMTVDGVVYEHKTK